MKKRYLQFVNWKTSERAESPGKVDVTGRSEREIERIETGMLRNCDTHAGWCVDDFTVDDEPSDSGSGPEGENSRSEVEGEAPQSGLSESEGIAQNPNEFKESNS